MTGSGLRASDAGSASGVSALVELTSALAQAETVDQLCQRALGVVERALGVDRASVLLLDDEGVMRFRAWTGLSDAYRRATEGHSPGAADTVDAEPIVVPDVEQDAELAALREVILQEGIHALAFVPICFEGQLLGKYTLYFSEPRTLAGEELQIARIVADQIAVSVKRHWDEAELRFSRDQLRAIFRGVADAITVQRPDGELVYANEAAARFLGMSDPEELLRTPVSEIMARFDAFNEDGTPLRTEQLPARQVFAGAPAAERTVRYRVRASGEDRWSQIKANPVLNPDGSVRLVVNIIHDVTAQRRREEWQRLLADTSALLAESLVSDETLRNIAALAVPGLADWCAVYVPAEERPRLAAVAHRDPEQVRTALELVERYPPDPERPGGAPWVLRTGKPQLIPEITDEALADAAVDEEHLRLLRALELRSAMTVPLVARGRTLAAISFATGSDRPRFSEDDLANAEEFARRAALAVDNALLHEAERDARRQAERAAALTARLQAVTAALSGAVTSEQVGEVIVGEGVQALGAQAGALFLVSDDGKGLELVAQVGYPERRAARHARTPLELAGPPTQAIASGDIVAVESGEELVARWPQYEEAQRATGDEATIAAPLVFEGRPGGALYVAFRSPRTFADWELDLVRTLARQCSQALERAHLYERDHEVAITLQRSLLPRKLPERDSLRVAAVYRPGSRGLNVGGDWYDAFELPDGRIAFAVGDVVGRGLEAATVMGELRNAERPYLLDGVPPDETLGRLNAFALRAADLSTTGRAFATVLVGVMDPADGCVTLASAGHPPPLVLDPSGGASFVELVSGPPIGAIDEPTYRLTEFFLARGATMALYTDGLIERRDRPLAAGMDELIRAVEAHGPRAPLEEVCERLVTDMVGDEEIADDLAILLLRLVRTSTLRRRVSARSEELAAVRRALREWLAEMGADEEACYDVVLAASEACANAIEHPVARRDWYIDVEARVVARRVEVVVRDSGEWREPDLTSSYSRGQGLMLISALMDDVEIDSTDDGTEVRMARTLATPAPQPRRPDEA